MRSACEEGKLDVHDTPPVMRLHVYCGLGSLAPTSRESASRAAASSSPSARVAASASAAGEVRPGGGAIITPLARALRCRKSSSKIRSLTSCQFSSKKSRCMVAALKFSRISDVPSSYSDPRSPKSLQTCSAHGFTFSAIPCVRSNWKAP